MSAAEAQAAPDSVDLDGYIDARGIRYIGSAARTAEGTYRVLADVGGALCRVEVRITGERAASQVQP